MPTVIISDNTTGADFSGSEDSDINESLPNFNEGGNSTLNTWQDTGSSNERKSLIRFTGLTNITGPVTVSSATLSVYATGDDTASTFNVYRVLRAWTEANSTWNNYTTSTAWATAGANSSGTDIASSATATAVTGGNAAYVDISTAQLAADVEDMINNGGNNGWILVWNSGSDSQFVHRSSEGTDGQRPKLSVTYTATGGSSNTIIVNMY